MPGGNLQPGTDYIPLPQSPPDPALFPLLNILITDPELAYQGEDADYSFAGYTGPTGDLLLFSVDANLYDREGWKIGTLQGGPSIRTRPGFTEKLILPMGSSCTKFAIIFPGTAENNLNHSTSSRNRIYMGVYDTEEENTQNAYATGKLLQQGSHPNRFLIDISERDGIEHYDPALEIYGFSFNGNQWQQGNGLKGYKIAATKLIDGCFRYVFINDGINLIRYKLTEDDLEYDDYVYDLTFANNKAIRTEMELIELNNGMIRIAIPGVGPNNVNYELKILDLNSNYEVVASSEQTVNLGDAEPYGVEFDASGRYVYFTHKATTALPNPLDIWDTQTETLLTASVPTSMEPFRESYIERYGADLYLASDASIGLLPQTANPSASLAAFAPNHQGIAPGYGSDAQLGQFANRYLLPDQVDDDDYGNFGSFSCNCCQVFGGSGTVVEQATSSDSQTWTPLDNPFNGGTGAEVTIRDELRIEAGGDIDIHDMIFYFKPGARVVIERGEGTVPGAMLTLKNTTLTLDFTCAETEFGECTPPILNAPMSGNPEPVVCEELYWKGVELQGYPDKIQPNPQWNFHNKPSFNFTHQGKFYMYENSKIEFAEKGLTVGSQTHNGMGGGIAIILESSFKDNIYGVDFRPYAWLNSSGNEIRNRSRIFNSGFFTTSEFLFGDQEFFPIAFVRLEEISSIELLGNHYENQSSVTTTLDAGIGVMLGNSGARISRYCGGNVSVGDPCPELTLSEFRGLKHGVSGRNDGGNRKLEVLTSKFDMNLVGVNVINFVNPDIVDNAFVIPRINNSYGLSLVSSSGYSVEGNEFVHGQGSSYPQNAAGVSVAGSGHAFNSIYRNVFNDLPFGIVSSGLNAHPQMLSQGLKFKCNQFSFPIRYADIFLESGNISEDQGVCAQSISAQAGNQFSHSSNHPSAPNHKDFQVSSAALSPTNLQISYWHHQIPPANLAPIAYTMLRVLPFQCQVAYDENNSCPVIKSTAIGGGHGGPKSSSSDETEWTTESILSDAQLHEDNVSDLAAELDGGQTEAILELIYQGASTDDIADLVTAAGSSLSNTVLKALAGSANDNYEALAAEAAGLPSWSPDATSEDGPSLTDVAVSTNEYESDWKQAREDRSNFWNRVVDIYQTDTAGVLPPGVMAELLNQYQPKSLERFVSNFAQTSDLVNADWVRSCNAVDYTNFGGLALPSMTEDGLPYNLPEHFEQGFFDNFGNAAALNALYIEHDQVYGPYLNVDLQEFEDDQNKSNASGSGDGTTMVATYPNPFTDLITFEITERDLSYKQLELRVYDVTGRTVWSGVYGADDTMILVDGREFPKGLLIYQVTIDGSNVENGKVMRVE